MLRISGGAPPPPPPPDADPPDAGPPPPPDPTAPPDGAKPKHQFNLSIKKVDPKIAVYMPPELGPFTCSNCENFDDGDGSCSIVDGPIDPQGMCHIYTPLAQSASADGPPPPDDGDGPPPMPPQGA